MKKQIKLSFSAQEVLKALQATYPDACTGIDHIISVDSGVGAPDQRRGNDRAIILEFTQPEGQQEKKAK